MLTANAVKLRNPPERTYWIYCLVDPRNDEIRYIGRSHSVYECYGYHVNSTRREQTIKANWLRELQLAGLTPRLMVFEQAETLDGAIMAEFYWIDYCRKRGANLLNGMMADWRNPENPLPIQHLNTRPPRKR